MSMYGPIDNVDVSNLDEHLGTMLLSASIVSSQAKDLVLKSDTFSWDQDRANACLVALGIARFGGGKAVRAASKLDKKSESCT